jgi:hypothetical protein
MYPFSRTSVDSLDNDDRVQYFRQALALGARAVFIGRPVLWGLVHNGEEGSNLIAREQLTQSYYSSYCS